MSRPIVTCRACERDRTHHARGLCRGCYKKARLGRGLDLADYRPTRDFTMTVDEVVVDRAARWVIHVYRTTPSLYRRFRSDLPDRPALSRGEKIAVLHRVRFDVPLWAAGRALGINAVDTRRYAAMGGEVAA